MPAKDEGDLLTGEDRAFARSMQQAREQRGWSQGDLAVRLADRGYAIGRVTISRIESMKRAARLGEAEAIARELGQRLPLMVAPDSRATMTLLLRPKIRGTWDALRGLEENARAYGGGVVALEVDAQAVRDMAASGDPLDVDAQAVVDQYLDSVNRVLSEDALGTVRAAIEAGRSAAQRERSSEATLEAVELPTVNPED